MDNLDLPAILRSYREENGLSQRGMAQLLNMSKSAYYRLENDLTKPTYEQIQRILSILHINPDTFREIDNKGRPVGTISYVKRGLLYGSISTYAALNCLADLAEAIEDFDLLEWAEAESKGYEDSELELPSYRWLDSILETECELDGNNFFINLPIAEISNKKGGYSAAYNLDIKFLDQSWPRCTGKIILVNESVQSDLKSTLTKMYGPNVKLIGALGYISAQSIQKVLLAVQETILRFLLDVETEIGSNPSLNELRAQKYLLGILLRRAQETVGSADHLQLPAKPPAPKLTSIIKGDEETFCDWLDEYEISTYELDEFYVLFETLQENPQPAGIVPPEMCTWAAKVTSSNPRFGGDVKNLLNALKVLFGVKE